MAPTGIGLEQKEQKKILDQSPGRREADSSSGCGDTSGFGLGGALWLCSPRWRRGNLRSRYLGSGGWISGPKYSCVVWYRRVRAGARVTQGHTNLHSIQTFGSWGGQAIAGALFEAGSQMMWCWSGVFTEMYLAGATLDHLSCRHANAVWRAQCGKVVNCCPHPLASGSILCLSCVSKASVATTCTFRSLFGAAAGLLSKRIRPHPEVSFTAHISRAAARVFQEEAKWPLAFFLCL